MQGLLSALIILCLAGTQALALTIISPTEGSIVREKVKIVIPRSAVPSDGFVAINIDGKFRAAAAMPEEVLNSGKSKTSSPYYTYIWDTKAPVLSSAPKAEPVILNDGKHEIEVQVHDALARRIDSAKISVKLANKVARPINAPPLKLYHRYSLGNKTVYHCKIDGEILDNMGQSLLSGVSAIKAEFDMIQTIEDVRSDGTALVRYKMGKDPLFLVYGRPFPVPEAAPNAPSIYKEIDKYGKVIRNDIVRKTNYKTSDVLLKLPGRPIQVGESWPSEFKIMVLGDVVTFQMQNVLDSIEWESGRECAKIQSTMTSLDKLNLIPGDKSSDEQTTAKGTGTFYFAYNVGKLLKASAVMEADMSIDPNTLSSLQSSTGGIGEAYASPYDANPYEVMTDDSDYYEGPSRRTRNSRRAPASTVNVYGPDGVVNQKAEKTTVRVRLNWSIEIK